jgi:hypothetical protein
MFSKEHTIFSMIVFLMSAMMNRYYFKEHNLVLSNNTMNQHNTLVFPRKATSLRKGSSFSRASKIWHHLSVPTLSIIS